METVKIGGSICFSTYEFVEKLVNACKKGVYATGAYKGIFLEATPNDSHDELIARYESKCAEKEAYRNSFEFKQEQKLALQKKNESIRACASSIERFLASDVSGLLDWLYSYLELAEDSVLAKGLSESVLESFKTLGFSPTINPSTEIDSTNKISVGNALVAYGLNGVADIGVPYPAFREFYQNWLKDFSE